MSDLLDKRYNKEGREYQIKRMRDIHQEICRLLILGKTNREIAYELGVSESMVSYTINSEIVKRQLEVMRGARDKESFDVAVEIKKFAPVALKILQEIAQDPNSSPRHKIQIATDMLDRAGFGAPKKVEAQHLHAHLTADDIKELKLRALIAEGGNGSENVDEEVIGCVETNDIDQG